MSSVVQAVVAAVAAVVKLYQASAAFRVVTQVALMAAQYAVAAKAANQRASQGMELQLKIDPAMPRQVAVGFTATGGSTVWAFTYTDGGGDTANKYLVRIIALSDFPIQGVTRVLEGSQELTFTGDIHTGLRVCDQHLTKTGRERLWLRVYKGSFTPTADADLISWSGGQWTSAHKGVGMAYAIVRSWWNETAFPKGEVEMTFELEGARIYDDRKDGSKPSRVGAHRLNDQSTWEYSANIANIIAQAVRGFYVNGSLIIGVQAEEADLTDANLLEAYNICDEDVALDGGGTEKRYQGGMMLTASESNANMLTDLQAAMDGNIYDRGGIITLIPGAARTPVFDLTDEDIIWTDAKSWQPLAPIEELCNYISGTYIEPTSGWHEKAFPIKKNSTWETDDGGERFSKEYTFRAVNSGTQVQRITQRMHKRTRYQGTIAFSGGIWLIEGEQGDWFTLTSERFGFTTKYFEIKSIVLVKNMRIAIIAREVSPSIDDWDEATDEIAPTDDYVIPTDYTLPVPGLTVDPDIEVGDAGFQQAVAIATVTGVGDPEESRVTHVEYEIAFTADLATATPLKADPIGTPPSVQRGLLPATDYSMRARSTDGTRQSDWTSWVDFTTPAISDISSAFNSNVADYVGLEYVTDSTLNTITITAAKVTIVDPVSGGIITFLNVSEVIDCDASGLNGLDTGTLGDDPWVYVWLVSDGTNIGAIASAFHNEPEAPPTGYTYRGRIGAIPVVGSPGSAALYNVIKVGNTTQYVDYIVAAANTAGGTAGSVSIPTWVAVDISDTVPPIATHVDFTLRTGSNITIVAPNDTKGPYNGASNVPPIVRQVGSQLENNLYRFLIEDYPNIYWASSAGTSVPHRAFITVMGFGEEI